MSNTTLITLDLDNTGIDDNQLRHIIQALCENTTLEEIMLNHNHITNDGVAAFLAARFPEMQGLKKISMYSNLFDTPTTAPPPTEITTPSVNSNSTQIRSNQQQDVHMPDEIEMKSLKFPLRLNETVMMDPRQPMATRENSSITLMTPATMMNRSVRPNTMKFRYLPRQKQLRRISVRTLAMRQSRPKKKMKNPCHHPFQVPTLHATIQPRFRSRSRTRTIYMWGEC